MGKTQVDKGGLEHGGQIANVVGVGLLKATFEQRHGGG